MRENSSLSPVVHVWPCHAALNVSHGMTSFFISPARHAPGLPEPGLYEFETLDRLVAVLRAGYPSITLDISAEAPVGFVFGGRNA